MPILHGANASPFVRKVKVICAEKSIEYEQNPMIPYFSRFSASLVPGWRSQSAPAPSSRAI